MVYINKIWNIQNRKRIKPHNQTTASRTYPEKDRKRFETEKAQEEAEKAQKEAEKAVQASLKDRAEKEKEKAEKEKAMKETFEIKQKMVLLLHRNNTPVNAIIKEVIIANA